MKTFRELNTALDPAAMSMTQGAHPDAQKTAMTEVRSGELGDATAQSSA